MTAIAVTTLLGGAAAAQAAAVTVGSPLTGPVTLGSPLNAATFANTTLPEAGANVTAPITGTLVRWRLQGTGSFRLRVLHPNGGGSYTATGTSAAEAGAGTSTATFTTSLAIHAGDLIGLDYTSTTYKIGGRSVPGATYTMWDPPFGDGETRPMSNGPGTAELAFNADVVAPPAVSEVTPNAGPTAGGTSVTIKGSDFSNGSAVTFGAIPASSFHVDADNQITAVSPAGAAGTVDVRVTTPSGGSAAVAADTFTYLPPPTLMLIGSPKATKTGVSLTVKCTSPSGQACALASTLTARTRVKGKRVVGVAKLRRVKVGSKSATVGANQTAVVAVRLNAKGRKLLKRFKRLPVRVDATWTAPSVLTTALTSKKLTIKATKHRKK